MVKVLLQKIPQAAALLFGITCMSFVVIHLAPGTPDSGSDMNPAVSLEAREKLTKLYGLDKPLEVQYLAWLFRVLRFDFGESIVDGEKVHQKILRAVPVTLGVNALSLVLSFVFGIPLGVWAAWRRGSLRERVGGAFLLALYSLPGFWIALLVMQLFAVHWHVLPVSGLHSLFYEEEIFWRQWLDTAHHLILPVAVITFAGAAAISRYVKFSMEQVLSQSFVRSARARGLTEQRVLLNHALRNALLPVITLVGLSVPALLGGSVVLESVFALPGMGRLFFNAVFQRDYPVIMGVLTLGAVLTLAGNALADAAYMYADPRIREMGRGGEKK